jgi:hypothetical protein
MLPLIFVTAAVLWIFWPSKKKLPTYTTPDPTDTYLDDEPIKN